MWIWRTLNHFLLHWFVRNELHKRWFGFSIYVLEKAFKMEPRFSITLQCGCQPHETRFTSEFNSENLGVNHLQIKSYLWKQKRNCGCILQFSFLDFSIEGVKHHYSSACKEGKCLTSLWSILLHLSSWTEKLLLIRTKETVIGACCHTLCDRCHRTPRNSLLFTISRIWTVKLLFNTN